MARILCGDSSGGPARTGDLGSPMDGIVLKWLLDSIMPFTFGKPLKRSIQPYTRLYGTRVEGIFSAKHFPLCVQNR